MSAGTALFRPPSPTGLLRAETLALNGYVCYQLLGEAHYVLISGEALAKAAGKLADGTAKSEKAALDDFKNGVFAEAVDVVRMHVRPGMGFYIPPGYYFTRRAVSKGVTLRSPMCIKSAACLHNLKACSNIPSGASAGRDTSRSLLTEAISGIEAVLKT